MRGRKGTSSRWTAIPAEFARKATEVLNEAFEDWLSEGTFVVEGWIYPEEVLLRVGFLRPERLAQVNVEVSVNSGTEEGGFKALGQCLDVAQVCIPQLLEEPDEKWSDEWLEYPFQRKKFWVRTSRVNSHLEGLADQLLSEDSPHLFHEASSGDLWDQEPEEPDEKATLVPFKH